MRDQRRRSSSLKLIDVLVKRILNTWQDSDVDVFSPDFQAFCDWLETDEDGNVAPATGWGLDYALKSWGSYWTVAGYYNASTLWSISYISLS